MTADLDTMILFAKRATPPPAHLKVADFEGAAEELVAKRQLPAEDFHAAYARMFSTDEDLVALLTSADRVRRAVAKRRRQIEDLESSTGCLVPSRCENGSSPERCDRLIENYAKAKAKPGESTDAAIARLSESDAWVQTTILAKRSAEVDPLLDLNYDADELALRRLADEAQVAAAAAPTSRSSLLSKAATVLRQQADLALMARIKAEGAGEKLSIADLVEAEDGARRAIRAQTDGDPVAFDVVETADEAEQLATMLVDTKKQSAARRLAKSLRAHEETVLKSVGDAQACHLADPELIRQKIVELVQRVKEAQFVGQVKEAGRLHRMALALGNRLKALQHAEAPALAAPTDDHVAAAEREVLDS